VYNLGPPADSKEYLHRAGRAGRIGSTTGGLVTSIVTPDELPRLEAAAAELGVSLAVEREEGQGLGLLPPGGKAPAGGEGEGGSDLDALKRGLEDIYKLL
jgi:superfamily II DNA/RNA helicase